MFIVMNCEDGLIKALTEVIATNVQAKIEKVAIPLITFPGKREFNILAIQKIILISQLS